jgi:ferric-dicitrate binding protein FerR (iron transport regulator)
MSAAREKVWRGPAQHLQARDAIAQLDKADAAYAEKLQSILIAYAEENQAVGRAENVAQRSLAEYTSAENDAYLRNLERRHRNRLIAMLLVMVAVCAFLSWIFPGR